MSSDGASSSPPSSPVADLSPPKAPSEAVGRRCSECPAVVAAGTGWLCGCSACRLILCSECAIRAHRLHSLIQVPDFVQEKQKSFTKIKTQMTGALESLRSDAARQWAEVEELQDKTPALPGAFTAFRRSVDASLAAFADALPALADAADVSVGKSPGEADLMGRLSQLRNLRKALVRGFEVLASIREKVAGIQASVSSLPVFSADGSPGSLPSSAEPATPPPSRKRPTTSPPPIDDVPLPKAPAAKPVHPRRAIPAPLETPQRPPPGLGFPFASSMLGQQQDQASRSQAAMQMLLGGANFGGAQGFGGAAQSAFLSSLMTPQRFAYPGLFPQMPTQ